MTSDEAKALIRTAQEAVFEIEKRLPTGDFLRGLFHQIRIDLGVFGHRFYTQTVEQETDDAARDREDRDVD